MHLFVLKQNSICNDIWILLLRLLTALPTVVDVYSRYYVLGDSRIDFLANSRHFSVSAASTV